PAVHAFDLDPSAGRPDGLDDDTVHLVAEDDRVKAGQRAAEGAPAAHHFGYRGVGPEAEVEPPARLAAAAGDAGDDTVAAPVGELIERESAGDGNFADDRQAGRADVMRTRSCHPERSEGSCSGTARASPPRSLAPLGM